MDKFKIIRKLNDEMHGLIRKRLKRLDKKTLNSMKKAYSKTDEFNVWWFIYNSKKLVCTLIDVELRNRVHLKEEYKKCLLSTVGKM